MPIRTTDVHIKVCTPRGTEKKRERKPPPITPGRGGAERKRVDCNLEYRKGSADGHADFMSRLPEPALEHDGTGSSSLTPVQDGGIFLILACGLQQLAPIGLF